MVIHNYYMYKIFQDIFKNKNKYKNDNNIIYIVKEDIIGQLS